MKGNMMLLFLVLYPMIGALVSYWLGRFHKKTRDRIAAFIVITEFLCFAAIFALRGNSKEIWEFTWEGFAGRGLHFTLDGFRLLYGTIASFMWMMTGIFSREYFLKYHNRNRYFLFHLLTLGATIGVFLSADLYTTFIFFEIMSFTSYAWVAHDQREESLKAAGTYLSVAVIGGLVMLMGLFLLYDALGTLEISKLQLASRLYPRKGQLYAAGACMLFGFGAKAGVFPLQIWLPKAHPVAPAPASALLSGILTKTGIFGILVISCNLFLYNMTWGVLLAILGMVTMLLGAVLAVFSVDLKRTLACSSVSQIGFIVVGIGAMCILGEENGLAVRGSLLHMVNHSLLKLVLFMAAGVVYMNIHKLNLNEIRGFGRKKPLLHFVFLMGSLGIAGIPLWNGYISKTLLHESILAITGAARVSNMSLLFGFSRILEWAFLLSGGLTIAYMTKLYIALFVEKNGEEEVQKKYDSIGSGYMNHESAVALTVSAVLLPVFGLLPHFTMDKLADMGQGFMHLEEMKETVNYFSLENLEGSLVTILIGAAVYMLIVRMCLMKKGEYGKTTYINLWPSWLDVEELLYRPLLLRMIPLILRIVCRIGDSAVDWIILLLRKTVYRDRKIPHELAEGNLFTHTLGVAMDDITLAKNHIKHREQKNKVSYAHKLAVRRDILLENSMIIRRSLSFGLFMFCLGLCLTLIYLLFIK